jgi:hypothetical protein
MSSTLHWNKKIGGIKFTMCHPWLLIIFLLQVLKFNETYQEAHIICIAVVDNYYRSAGKNSFHIAMAYEASY